MSPQIARPSVGDRLIPQLGFNAEWALAIFERHGIADAIMSTLKTHICCGPAANGNIAVSAFPRQIPEGADGCLSQNEWLKGVRWSPAPSSPP